MVAKLAIVPVDYPAVLGVPIAGVVEGVGPGVTKVSFGDRIFCATKILSHKKAKYGGLQRFSIVDAAQAVLVSSPEWLKTTVRSHFCHR
jgi:NADPH:quinone reductase-like Zn-dependent oxidoreductase